MRKILATVVCVIGTLIAAWAIAGQSSLFSPTTGTVSGLQLTNNYNSALDSLNTCNSGTSAPTNQLSGSPSKGNCWMDTSVAGYAGIKIYDGTQWMFLGTFDTSNHIWMPVWAGNINTTVTAGATTDLCGSPQARGAAVILTGSATITSFGTGCPAGTLKYVVFSGAQTLTNNSVLLTNITSPGNGDIMLFATDGVNWYEEGSYSRNGVVNCPSGVTAATVVVVDGRVTHC